MIDEGDQLPGFDLPRDGGGRLGLTDLKGQPFVLYLYPKDDTPGCTKEAQGFAERYQDFKAAGVEVIGLSKDSAASHDKFRDKHGLPFPLLSDETGELVEALGSWVEKSMYGKKYMGVDRSTFLVDGEGVVRKAWRKVKVPEHVDAVLKEAVEVKG